MTNKKVSLKQITNFLFYISLFLVQLAIFGQNVFSIGKNLNYIFGIAYFIMFSDSILVLISIKTSYKKWLLMLILFLLFFANYYLTGSNLLLILFFSCVSALNLDFEKLIKTDLVLKLIILFMIILGYYLGVAENTYFIRHGVIRIAFGFNHPNALGYFLLILYYELIYIINTKEKKISKLKYILLFIPVIYIMNLTGSRTSEITICLFLLLLIVFNNKIFGLFNIRIIRKLLFITIFFAFTMLSFKITNDYNNGVPYVNDLNYLLSNRISIQNIFLKSYDIKLFGNEIEYLETLDNVYIRLLLNFGVFGWCFFCYLYKKSFDKVIEEQNYILLMIFFTLLIYGLMEWGIIRPYINIFLLYYSTSLYNHQKNNKIQKEKTNI